MILQPDWQVPEHVKAFSTTREGGNSQGLYAGWNLGQHVGDDRDVVQSNRDLLTQWTGNASVTWLNQVHGVEVACVDRSTSLLPADASYATCPKRVCAVLSADCLPVLLCDNKGEVVAAVHCGWRGLSRGILVNTLAKMKVLAEQVHAWLGPAIGPEVYEVGDEVREAFMAHNPKAQTSFVRHEDRWLANLYQLARQSLEECGVKNISGGQYCTYSDPERFYSYRRDGLTGRQATLIWIEGPR